MRLGGPDRAGMPQATLANALRVAALDACPRRILTTERCGRLLVPCGVQRLRPLAHLASQEAWLLPAPGALRSMDPQRGTAKIPHFPEHWHYFPLLRGVSTMRVKFQIVTTKALKLAEVCNFLHVDFRSSFWASFTDHEK